MKALCVTAYGSPASVQAAFPRPQISEGFVLLKVSKASVNPIDFKTRDGNLKMVRYKEPPFVVGYDVCGEVVESLHDATPIGTKLFGRVRDGDMGTIGEFVAVRPEFLGVLPPGMDEGSAACIGLAGLTALQMIQEVGGAEKNSSVLILGGPGGVGHFAVQICRILGFKTIIATASTTKVEFVKQLGATQVIDYKTQNVVDMVPKESLDCVLDTVGDAESVFSLIKKGGKCVSIAASPTSGIFPTEDQIHTGVREPISSPGILSLAIPLISAKTRFHAWYAGITYAYLFVKPNREDVQQLGAWVVENKLKVHIHKRFSLDQSNEALEELAKGAVIGKLLIDMQ